MSDALTLVLVPEQVTVIRDAADQVTVVSGPDTATVIALSENADQVTVVSGPDTATVIATGSTGPAGPLGAQGPEGPQGPPGPAGGLTYIHDQAAPSATWTIAHNLNRFPAVAVVDSANSVVYGDVVYDSANQVTVTFAAAFGGKAYL